MPSQDTPSLPRRPSIVSRHSSGSVHFAKSPSENVSTSHRVKSQRHMVSHARVSSRVPSHSKNINKLAKVTLANFPEDASGPRPTHVKRNSSNLHLARNTSHTNLKKNHSETCLRKNRSSGQLTRLAKHNSSKNFLKGAKAEARTKPAPLYGNKAPEEQNHPTVRFDLGDDDVEEVQEDAWTEDSASQSPNTTRSNTRANTRHNSVTLDPGTHPAPMWNQENQRLDRYNPDAFQEDLQSLPPQDESSPPHINTASETHVNGNKACTQSRPPDGDKITSRLLNRTVSFSAAPQVSNVSATSHSDSQSPRYVNHVQTSQHDSSGRELVSRFVNTSTSSATPCESSILRHHEIHDIKAFQNGETPKFGDSVSDSSAAPSRPSSQRSGSFTSGHHPSRLQQKLRLDREGSSIEHNPVRPPSPLRSSRFAGPGVSLQTVCSQDGIHPWLRQLFDQTAVEYRRVRIYQNPLVDAIRRLQETGNMPKAKLASTTSDRRDTHNGSGESQFGVSQSLRDSKIGKNGEGKARVTFQSMKGGRSDGNISPRKSTVGRRSMEDEDSDFGSRDVAREICRRMWERQPVIGDDG